ARSVCEASGGVMNAKTLYRIAAVLFVLFAVGHTFGFLSLKPPTTEGQAVFAAMNDVHFQVHNATFSYGGFYRGFGLSISASLLFSAMLAWQLSNLTGIGSAGSLGWTFFTLQVVNFVLACLYFSIAPVVLSAIVAGFLASAAWKVQHVRRAEVR